eukprot:5540337-Pyramimonas_sp.AAC.1
MIDQCLTGLRDSKGTLVRKLRDMMANNRAVLQSVEGDVYGPSRTCTAAQSRTVAGGPVHAEECSPEA